MTVRWMCVVAFSLLVVSSQIVSACDYEVCTNYPGGTFACMSSSLQTCTQQRPHTPNSGIAFRFNHAIRGVMTKTESGWSTANPPAGWLFVTAYYSGGTTETITYNNSTFVYMCDDQTNWYYRHSMTNWFSAPVGCLVTQVVMISMNSNMYADVVGLFRIDTDGDGLRDTQEEILGTDTNLWDTDGDGMSDGAEVRTATNPTNALSYFSITAMTNAGFGSVDFTFAWPSTNGKSYRLERFFNPVSLVCTTIQDAIAGNFPVSAYNFSAQTSWTSCFFRVVQTNDNVIGRNAVGYVKVLVLATNQVFAGLNFKVRTNTIQGIFGNQLTGGGSFNTSDQVLRYDPAAATYRRYWKRSSDGLWLNANTGSSTDTFDVADGFWIYNIHNSNQTLCFIGELPDFYNMGGTTTDTARIEQGLNQMAFAFPLSIAISNLSFKTQAYGGGSFNTSDQIMKFDPLLRSYKRYWRSAAANAWVDIDTGVPTPDAISIADGFWYRRYTGQAAFDWAENKPYTWPK